MGDQREPQLPSLEFERQQYINRRWTQLNLLTKEWGDKAVSFLTLINAGGAVAVLSFLGASATARESASARLALLFFAVGLIAVGLLIARTVHHMEKLYKGWQADVGKYFDKSTSFTWTNLIDDDNRRVGRNLAGWILGYFSFGCFLAGCIAGSLSLFSGTSLPSVTIPY